MKDVLLAWAILDHYGNALPKQLQSNFTRCLELTTLLREIVKVPFKAL